VGVVFGFGSESEGYILVQCQCTKPKLKPINSTLDTRRALKLNLKLKSRLQITIVKYNVKLGILQNLVSLLVF
jgi:hypothetical protein